jgi:hypothetical protein
VSQAAGAIPIVKENLPLYDGALHLRKGGDTRDEIEIVKEPLGPA